MADSPELFFQEALKRVDALQSQVDGLQWCLVLATCLLILGLVLEYYEYLPKFVVLLARTITPSSRSLQGKHVPRRVGRILIVISLALLGAVEFTSMAVQTRLREANAQLMLDANGRTWGDGARGRYLLGERRRAMIAPLKKYGGARVELRYCEENSGDHEINDFISLLNAPILRASGWRITKPAPIDCQSKIGLKVQVLPSSSSRTRNAAKSLVSAFLNNHLEVLGGRVHDWPDGDPLPRDSNTVVVYVFPRS